MGLACGGARGLREIDSTLTGYTQAHGGGLRAEEAESEPPRTASQRGRWQPASTLGMSVLAEELVLPQGHGHWQVPLWAPPSSSSALGLGPTAARTNSLEAPALGASGQATSQGSCGPGRASCRIAMVLELVSAHWWAGWGSRAPHPAAGRLP